MSPSKRRNDCCVRGGAGLSLRLPGYPSENGGVQPSSEEVAPDLIRQWRNTSWLPVEQRWTAGILPTSCGNESTVSPCGPRKANRDLLGCKTLTDIRLFAGIAAEPFTPVLGMTGLATLLFYQVKCPRVEACLGKACQSIGPGLSVHWPRPESSRMRAGDIGWKGAACAPDQAGERNLVGGEPCCIRGVHRLAVRAGPCLTPDGQASDWGF